MGDTLNQLFGDEASNDGQPGGVSPEGVPAKQCETCALAVWSGLGDAVTDCDYGHDGAVDTTDVDAWLEHQTGDCPGHADTEVQDG